MATKKSTPTTVTLKNRDVLESLGAFQALDKCSFEPEILLAVAKTGIALKVASEAVLQVRDKIAKEYFEDGKVDIKDPKFAEYKNKVETALDETTEVSTTKLSVDDLKLEENKISVSTIMTLDWLIDA